MGSTLINLPPPLLSMGFRPAAVKKAPDSKVHVSLTVSDCRYV